MSKTKSCAKCGIIFLATTVYFYKQKKGKDGLKSTCKSCNREYDKKHKKEYYQENKEVILDYKKEHYLKNKNQYQLKNKNYYKNNREKCLNYREEYYRNNKDKIVQHDAQYYAKNKDKIIQQKGEYFKNNKDKIYKYHIQYNQKRRSLKGGLLSTFTIDQWEFCKKYFDNKCAYCGKENALTQDHFVPLSKQGEYTKSNVIPACKSCNSKKINKNYFEWYQRQPFYNKRRELKILEYLNYNAKTKIQQFALF